MFFEFIRVQSLALICKHMNLKEVVTNKTKRTEANYHLHGHTLELVTSAKYLGLIITNKLQWDQHITDITAEANKTLGFLKRNLKIPSIRIKEQAYQILVCPLVEYASTV